MAKPKYKPKKIGIVADLHCGSKWGLLSPDNEEHKQNIGQKYLWDCWLHLAKTWGKLDMLIINGDMIDGKQRKSDGTGILTANLSEQADMAIECVEAFVERTAPTKIIRSAGTPYHEGFDGTLKHFDTRFGLKRRQVHGLDPFDIVLADGIIINVKHHPEGAAALYLGTLQDRETLWATITEDRQGLPRAQFLIRSHLHMYGRFDGCGKIHAITPCFQLQTPYAKKQKYYRWHPTIGGIMLKYDEMHDEVYHVVKTTYDLPRRKAVNYDDI